MSPTSLSASALVIVLVYFLLSRWKKPKVNYPPGPPPKPFIGNLLDIPSKKAWVGYADMAKKYNSDIIHLSSGKMHIIVLTTLEVAKDLLEKRARTYSTKPFNVIMEMVGTSRFSPFEPYGDVWRMMRKLMAEGLKKEITPIYHDILMERTHMMLELLLDEPEGFMQHTKMLGASASMSILSGYDIDVRQKGENDKYLAAAEYESQVVGDLQKPGYTIIALLPFLRHIPPWFPGASTQRRAAKSRAASMLFRNGTFEYAKKHMAAGTLKQCVTGTLLSGRTQVNGIYEHEEVIKDTMAGLYLGAVTTMQRAQNNFIMSMALHPEEQQKAQGEIDRILGHGTLPTFKDRSALPYVEAVFRESQRWRPASFFGSPHATTEDDVYRDYFIPKSKYRRDYASMVNKSNVCQKLKALSLIRRALSRDENIYPNADSFKPQRFFKPDGTLNNDTIRYGFGIGRRICPGEYMADALTWMSIVSMLAMFDIRKAKDENGREIPIDPDAYDSNGYPDPFKCSITARSPQNEVLIRNAASVAHENLHLPTDA